ncbi:MAG: tRNA uridine-5-carboxymethylaminomethyl(34) synthesis GTPase MnmE [Candidatus Puniceispirillaceae bacterium]
MTDTIFALATPPGQSAIAIFRLSGPHLSKLASQLSGAELHHRQAKPVRLYDEEGAVLDEVVLVYFEAPASPTGEDVLEIHCHGSLAVIEAITQTLSNMADMRPALAGEFSRRAFDNGKFDLTEIEGLADLIEAQTDSQRRQALGQLQGIMRKKATSWRTQIIHLAGQLESLIDFADEDLPDDVYQSFVSDRAQLIDSFKAALADGARGEMIRNGVSVALMGPVNAGKSTALNALAKRPAAIVSDEAGTTRDVIEVRLNLEGVAVILQDTAGIRDEAGTIEAIGIERAHQAAEEADLVIVIADGAHADWYETAEALCQRLNRPVIKIVNKKDKLPEESEIKEYLALSLYDEGDCALLEAELLRYCRPLNSSAHQPVITRARHRLLVEKALSALEASCAVQLQEGPELIAEELRAAADALGQMTGQIDIEDILSDIFTSFCIGK